MRSAAAARDGAQPVATTVPDVAHDHAFRGGDGRDQGRRGREVVSVGLVVGDTGHRDLGVREGRVDEVADPVSDRATPARSSSGSSTARTASAAALEARWESAVDATPSQTTATERPHRGGDGHGVFVARAPPAPVGDRCDRPEVHAPSARSASGGRPLRLGAASGSPDHPGPAGLAEQLVLEDRRLARRAGDRRRVGLGRRRCMVGPVT